MNDLLTGVLLLFSSVDNKRIYAICTSEIASQAAKGEAISVDTGLVEPVRQAGQEKTARLQVRIRYPKSDGTVETKNARVDCAVDADGHVAIATALR